mmetsp:Transcript_25076/g.28825  ORF Transcript_25076/g.28825 Transcript_25076/m.28825 type:complete len:124 (-) Transcript_25076:60-431(-)
MLENDKDKLVKKKLFDFKKTTSDQINEKEAGQPKLNDIESESESNFSDDGEKENRTILHGMKSQLTDFSKFTRTESKSPTKNGIAKACRIVSMTTQKLSGKTLKSSLPAIAETLEKEKDVPKI